MSVVLFSRLDVQSIVRLAQLHCTHQGARPAKDKNWYARHTVMNTENKCANDDDIGQEGFLQSPPPHGATAPTGPGPPHCRRFTITLRHTILGRSPLDEWSVRRRDLYLTTKKTLATYRLASGGIRTRNPSKRAVADPFLRPRWHWDRRPIFRLTTSN